VGFSDLIAVPKSHGRTTKVDSTSSPYTASDRDNVIWADSSKGDVVINLPSAIGRDGYGYHIFKTATGHKVTINPAPGSKETINGSGSNVMTGTLGQVELCSDGSNWWAW
jgi:hypothetical protein